MELCSQKWRVTLRSLKSFGKKSRTWIMFLVFSIIILIPNLFIPMVSDDVFYSELAGKGDFVKRLIDTAIPHYFSWSGRLLTDIEARIVLHLPLWVGALVKTATLALLILLIANLPRLVLNKRFFQNSIIY